MIGQTSSNLVNCSVQRTYVCKAYAKYIPHVNAVLRLN